MPTSELVSCSITNRDTQDEARFSRELLLRLDTPSDSLRRLPTRFRAAVEGVGAAKFGAAALTEVSPRGLKFRITFTVPFDAEKRKHGPAFRPSKQGFTLSKQIETAVTVNLLDAVASLGCRLAPPVVLPDSSA